MSYQINLGAWNRIFAVPADVVDKHLKLAGSAQLKVLLWLLRYAGENNEPETIGKALGLARADVCDAMQYWIEAGLIVDQNGVLGPDQAPEIASVPITVEVPNVQPTEPVVPLAPITTVAPVTPVTPVVPTRPVREKPKMLSAGEIASRINASDEIRFMLDTAEEMFARPLSTPENGALLSLYDYDGLPADVIVMMIQYALDQNKCNMRYIEKMAQGWIERGIDSHEKAEEYLRVLSERKSAWNRVRRLFGIADRRPSGTEEECAVRWVNEWHFTDEMVKEAYDRCINATGKVQFKYINSILERWQKEGIMTIGDAMREKDPEPKKRREEPKKSTSYDLDAFEKSLYGGNEG